MPQRVTDFTRPISMEDFKYGGNDQETRRHTVRTLLRKTLAQAVAASGTLALGVVRQPGRVVAARILAKTIPAAGESITVDIRKNGSTVLTAVMTLNSTTGAVSAKWIQGTVLNTTAASVVAGDVITAVAVYTAGGGPTPIANTLIEVDFE